MAVSKKNYKYDLPLHDGGELKKEIVIPQDYIIDYDYTSFKPERRSRAKRQINNLKKKMELHAHLKTYCIEHINKIILKETGVIEIE